jgi:hypothetical protein
MLNEFCLVFFYTPKLHTKRLLFRGLQPSGQAMGSLASTNAPVVISRERCSAIILAVTVFNGRNGGNLFDLYETWFNFMFGTLIIIVIIAATVWAHSHRPRRKESLYQSQRWPHSFGQSDPIR